MVKKKDPDLSLMKLTAKCRRQTLISNNILFFNYVVKLWVTLGKRQSTMRVYNLRVELPLVSWKVALRN